MGIYPSWLRKLLKEWDLRLTVLFSLTFQILLNFLGNRRKYNNKLWIRIAVWSAYITADSVATFALGILSSNLIELYDKGHVAGSSSSLDANTQLSAFWAPFLILHLGGPDTITAYALEDNELWLRHLIGLVVQTVMALSVFLVSCTASSLSILSLVMFLPGIIKYGERTWVLRLSSRQQRLESSRSFSIRFDPLLEINSEEDALRFAEETLLILSNRAFLDDTVDQNIRTGSSMMFRAMSSEYAFKVIEIELGMMYDLLYTKAPLLFTHRGLFFSRRAIFLRLITFFLTCSVMVLFPVLVDKHNYSKVDLWITYLLIIEAVIHDIYAALLLVLSDVFAAWLIKHRNDSIVKTLNCFPLLKKQPSTGTGPAPAQQQHQPNTSTSTRRWSNKMSQYSLLRFTSSKIKPWMSFKLLNKRIEMGKYWQCEVSEELRTLIFKYVKEKAEDDETSSQWRQLMKSKIDLDQGERIIIWHIATEVWYYSDRHFVSDQFRLKCKMIKRVSRYMMYLLVERPSMLSVEDRTATDHISLRRIMKIADKERIQSPSRADKITSNKAEACKRLLEKYPHTDSHKFNTKREEELIYFAMELVRKANHESQALESKWKRIESVWMDMLGYVARKCKGNKHAHQLRHGGELLTHVWLLLCHLGLTDHYLIKHDEVIKFESDWEE